MTHIDKFSVSHPVQIQSRDSVCSPGGRHGDHHVDVLGRLFIGLPCRPREDGHRRQPHILGECVNDYIES